MQLWKLIARERELHLPGESVEDQLYYTIPETMKLYGLSQDQIYKRIKKYAIEKVKIGKYIKISKRDLEKAIGKPKVI